MIKVLLGVIVQHESYIYNPNKMCGNRSEQIMYQQLHLMYFNVLFQDGGKTAPVEAGKC